MSTFNDFSPSDESNRDIPIANSEKVLDAALSIGIRLNPSYNISLPNESDRDIWYREEFIVASLPLEQSEALYQFAEDASEKSDDRKPIGTLFLLLFISFTFFAGFAGDMAGSKLPFKETYLNAPYVFWMAVLSFLLFAFSLHRLSKYRDKPKKHEHSNTLDKLRTERRRILAEFGVPKNAVATDIFTPTCMNVIDELIEAESDSHGYDYVNSEFRVYRQGKTLFIAHMEEKYAIPLCDLREIRTVNKRVSFPLWHKDRDPDDGPYRQYNLRMSDDGNIVSKPYYTLVIDHSGKEWNISFPCYELPTFEDLTGLKAEER